MSRPRIVVVGLGPGDPDLVTAGTLAAIQATPQRYLRTAVHPSAHLVAGAETFDHHYEGSATFDEVYRSIVDDLLRAARLHGEVLYAVPGSPRVLERTVDLLDEAAAAGEVELEVLAAMSFVDLAWVRLGVDPYEQGVRLIDGHRFAIAAAGERGPLLVAHCHNRRVLSDVKLAVETPPDRPVVILQRLGLPDEAITAVEWADLDRTVEPDHLTSLYIPQMAAPVAGEVASFVELVATLRAECPWDAEQTHATLGRHLLEETYEVLEALDAVGDGGPETEPAAYAHLEEELGDLLFQIVFHCTLATEAGAFGLADVANGVNDKLVHRHPHVFGDVRVAGSGEVAANWEQIKKVEKGRESIFEGIPVALPALVYALKVHKKASAVGLPLAGDVPTTVAQLRAVMSRVTDETSGVGNTADPSTADPSTADSGESVVGDLLLATVALARASGVDPEGALRSAANRLRAEAEHRERAAPSDPAAPPLR